MASLGEHGRFATVVRHLGEAQAAEVSEAIVTPHPSTPYTTLKNKLLERLLGTQAQRLRQLTAPDDVGDRRPSSMLRHMRTLAGTDVGDTLLRQLWMQRLPPVTRAVLVGQPALPLDALAELADSISEAAASDTGAAGATCATSAQPPNPDVQQLASCIMDLTQQVAALKSPQLTIDLGLPQPLPWRFVIADVSCPILGADFLAKYDLLTDCKRNRLVHAPSNTFVQGNPAHTKQHSVKAVTLAGNTSPFSKILAEFPELTRPAGLPHPVKHKTVHHIRTTPGPPVAARPRRLAPAKLLVAQAEFDNMVRTGTARPSDSPWSSPLHLAPKGETAWRPCGDYRALNARTVPDRYPVRHIQDATANLAGCTVFSVVDMVKAYHHIPVHPDDIPKTAITTPFGAFEFPMMTFGLRNAAQTFQRFIDEVTRGLTFCFPYIDDVLVFSKNEDEHRQHLRSLFSRLAEYGIIVNAEKTVLGQPEVRFLGILVSSRGTRPPPDRLAALREYPPPPTAAGLRRFLGIINFYRSFLPRAAHAQAPLHDILATNALKGAQAVPWTPELLRAFDACKRHLAEATMRAHPVAGAQLGLFVDASMIAAGAALHQRVDKQWQPLDFYSKKLSQRQAETPPYHRELLAVYLAVQHWRQILEAQPATIYTDHKPLVHAFAERRDKLAPVQLNQLTFISQFTTDIQHIAGKDNVVADALSRVEDGSPEDSPPQPPPPPPPGAATCTITAPPTPADLEAAQATDDELRAYLAPMTPGSALRLEPVAVPGHPRPLLCDTSTGRPRPFVPAAFRRRAFDAIHGLSHPGARSSVRLVSARFVWPELRKDVRAWANACEHCQRAKVTRHASAPLADFDPPTARFSHVHLDLVGVLPSASGFRYILTMMDRWTRWPEAIPLQTADAEAVTSAFLLHWVARFGAPQYLTTDRGSQFQSHLFRSTVRLLGAQQYRSTAYHPQTSGMLERWHRPLKASMMCHSDSSWLTSLPWVLLGLRSALKEDIGASTADLVYGEPLRLPGDLLTQPSNTPPPAAELPNLLARIRKQVELLRPQPASRHGRKAVFTFPALATATHVYLRDDTVRGALQPPYTGPHAVLAKDDKTILRCPIQIQVFCHYLELLENFFRIVWSYQGRLLHEYVHVRSDTACSAHWLCR
ncbi:hypothetical protein ONE63_011376 [Megalurothrips usitatus]|uniref:RNA-directed DNA polymerase n=1 Tax=Megalurothrips usitatus TaxID=439358 RepID=A0AAV7WZE8_9NEOP|nr:hypothetical protein ONE63_011376 [Megalurothrips usitatus]